MRGRRSPKRSAECCSRDDILWDLAAVYPPSVAWTDRPPPATIFNGPVVDVAGTVEAALTRQPVPGASLR